MEHYGHKVCNDPVTSNFDMHSIATNEKLSAEIGLRGRSLFTGTQTCYHLFECPSTKYTLILACEMHRSHQENHIHSCASSLAVEYSDKNNIWVSLCQMLATESENSRKQMSPQMGDKQIHFFVLQILHVTCHLMIITFVGEKKPRISCLVGFI